MGKIKIAAIVFIVTALVCGCSVEKTKTEKKTKKVDKEEKEPAKKTTTKKSTKKSE